MRTDEATTRTAERPVATAALLAGAYFLVLLAVGPCLHPMPAAGVENDDFQQLAAAWLRGQPPRDVFRPALYPLLVAATSLLTGDLFAAGRIVSSAGAALLVGAVFTLVRRAGSAPLAWCAAVAVAVHPLVLVHGVLVATDMLAFGFAAVTLAVAARGPLHVRGPGGRARELRWLALLALWFALAYWTRYTNLALLVPIGLALLGGTQHALGRWPRLLSWLAFAGLFLLPHCALSLLQFGEPFHDENYRNVALRHYYELDFARIGDLPFGSLADVWLHDPMRVLANAADGLRRFFLAGLPELFSGGAGLSWLFAAPWLALAGLAVLRARGRALRLLGAYAIASLAAVLLTYHPLERLLLPPWLAVVVGAFLALGRVGANRWQIGLGIGLCLLSAAAIPPRLALFQREHVTDVVAAIEQLRRHQGRAIAVMATTANVRSVVPPEVVVGGLDPVWGRGYVEQLDRFLARARAGGYEFILADDYSHRRGLADLREELARRGIDVLVDRRHAVVFRAFTPGVGEARADPDRFGGLCVTLRVPTPVLAGGRAELELVERGLRYPAVGEDGALIVRLPPPAGPLATTWTLRPHWCDVTGRAFAGESCAVVPGEVIRHWLAERAAPLCEQLPRLEQALPAIRDAAERARLGGILAEGRALAAALPALRQWLHWRERVDARAPEFRAAWQRCRAALPGLTAMVEVVPIGRHPTSGRWWFYDLAIACGPDRGDDVLRCAIPQFDATGHVIGGDPAAVLVYRDGSLCGLADLPERLWQRFGGDAAAPDRLRRLGFALADRRLRRRPR